MKTRAQFEAVNPEISLAAIHDRMVVFAQDAAGRLAHIDSVKRGKACDCRCLACDEALIARQGDIKAHSFAHASGTECKYAIDAMLNRLAQELIAARGSFITPALTVRAACTGPTGKIDQHETIPSRHVQVESATLELRIHQKRPSVVLQIKGRALLLELTHAHRLDAVKRSAIEQIGLPAIEMHLAECKFDTIEQFENLLDDTRHMRWLFNPKANDIQARLDAVVQEQLARQNAQYAQHQVQQQAMAEQQAAAQQAARLTRERAEREALAQRLRLQAEQDHLRRQEQARLDSIARANKKKPSEDHQQILHYRLQDGGLMIRHERDNRILIVPETGQEKVLELLKRMGLTYDAAQRGYPTTAADLPDILPALMPHVKSVRSV